MAAKLRPRGMLPRFVSSTAARVAEAPAAGSFSGLLVSAPPGGAAPRQPMRKRRPSDVSLGDGAPPHDLTEVGQAKQRERKKYE